MSENLGKTRICKSCHKELPETEDYFSKQSNSTGKEWWNRHCRECYKFICQGKNPLMEKQDLVKNIKICSKCKKEKDLDAFKQGRNQCNECMREYDREYYQRKKSSINAPEITAEPQKIPNNVPETNKSAAPKNVKKSTKKINELIIEEGFNGLSGDLKAIDLYKKLSQKIFILMRKNRIDKYQATTQNIILELMNACCTHLQKELQSTKKSNSEMEKPFKIKKEVINIDWEEIQE